MKKLKDFEKTKMKLKVGKWYNPTTGILLLSPSYLMRPLNNYKFGKLPEEIRSNALVRGKAFGEAVEIFETTGEKYPAPFIMSYWNAYMSWKENEGKELDIVKCEYHVATSKFHGYIDLMGVNKKTGEIVAIEMKTRKVLEQQLTDRVQNLIYSKALPGVKFNILMLNQFEQYAYEPLNFDKEAKDALKVLIAFRGLLGNTKIKGD